VLSRTVQYLLEKTVGRFGWSIHYPIPSVILLWQGQAAIGELEWMPLARVAFVKFFARNRLAMLALSFGQHL
jgi:hypothetical protein